MFRRRDSVFRLFRFLFRCSQSAKSSLKNRFYSSPAFCFSFSLFLNVAGVGGLFKPFFTRNATQPPAHRQHPHQHHPLSASVQDSLPAPQLCDSASSSSTFEFSHKEKQTSKHSNDEKQAQLLCFWASFFVFLDARSLGPHRPG